MKMIPRRKLNISIKTVVKSFIYNIFSHDYKHIEQFEEKCREYLNLDNIVATSSGRSAIVVGLMSLGLKPGDEILVPSVNLGELVILLREQGYVVNLVDCSFPELRIDVEDLKKKLTGNVKAVMLTHLFGGCQDLDEVLKVIKEKNILLVEDCAHTFGAYYNDIPLGKLGDMAAFSLESNKPLPTYGGGLLYIKNEESFKKARDHFKALDYKRWPHFKKICFVYFENFLITSIFYKYLAKILFSDAIANIFEKFYRGANTKQRKKYAFSAVASKIGLDNLESFKRLNSEKMKLRDNICSELERRGIFTDKFSDKCKPVYYTINIYDKDPASLRKKMFKKNIDIGIGTEVIDDCSKYFDKRLKNSKKVEDHIVSLPCDKRFLEKLRNGELDELFDPFNDLGDT